MPGFGRRGFPYNKYSVAPTSGSLACRLRYSQTVLCSALSVRPGVLRQQSGKRKRG